MHASDNKGTNDVTTKYLSMLTDPNVAVRRGSALALGVLPYKLLASQWRNVLLKLCGSCKIEVLNVANAIYYTILGSMIVLNNVLSCAGKP